MTAQNIFLIIYGLVYFYTWKLFLSYFSYLKPFAIIWILSAFICLLLSKPRKQLPFLAFFIGSIFGPLGILMCLISKQDIRTLNESQKDIDFYGRLFRELETLHEHIMLYSKRDDYLIQMFTRDCLRIYDKLIYLADYFGIKSDLKVSIHPFDVRPYSAYDLMAELKRTYLEFNKEYSTRFGLSFDMIKKRLENINTDIQRLKEKEYLSHTKGAV